MSKKKRLARNKKSGRNKIISGSILTVGLGITLFYLIESDLYIELCGYISC